MAKKTESDTVPVKALVAGVRGNGSGGWQHFKEGESLPWAADDAERAQASGIILIDQPAAKAK